MKEKDREKMRYGGRRRRSFLQPVLLLFAILAGFGLFMLALRPLDPPIRVDFPGDSELEDSDSSSLDDGGRKLGNSGVTPCATVEEMGKDFSRGVWSESLRVRAMIEKHFVTNGASRVRDLPPEKFCSHGFVLGKTAEAGFGNEMYKVLTAAALSVMLNRSLIIGQTRHIEHLWRSHGCESKYGRQLVMRIDDFEKPRETNVLCGNWKEWEQPIIWFQGTTDAVAAQFFLKNIHSEMRIAAFDLFGDPKVLETRPNVFGELMRVLIYPTKEVQEAVDWVINGREDPDISLHMRMLMNRSVRAIQAALRCIKKAIESQNLTSRPKVVLVSDTPSIVKSIVPNISEFAEVLQFDYENYGGNIFKGMSRLDFRVKDWGPAPRWVAFVDFFLASRARHAVVSGAHRRVGTTYAQLIAALAEARNLGNDPASSSFSFLSSFQSNLLSEGLKNQIGWGHVWNRYAGPLSCHNQTHQCAFTPLIPPAWWDSLWQSPIPRDINRLASFGLQVSALGRVDSDSLQIFCNSRKPVVKTIPIKL